MYEVSCCTWPSQRAFRKIKKSGQRGGGGGKEANRRLLGARACSRPGSQQLPYACLVVS